MSRQIKSRSRVAAYGEVFTARRQVSDMLNLIPDTLPLDATFLEPACGTGNFIDDIIRRKLRLIQTHDPQECRILAARAVASVYGVDIQKDNVEETRDRILRIVSTFYKKQTGRVPDAMLLKTVRNLTNRNILCGNTLTMQADDGSPLTFCEWMIYPDGRIRCREVLFADMIEHNGESTRYIAAHHYRWLMEQRKAA